MTAFASPALFPFTLAALVMGGLVLVEILSLIVGHSASALVDSLLDHDVAPGFHAEAGADSDFSPSGVMSWINVGRVPFLILLILALAGFAVLGFVIQAIAGAIVAPLPSLLAGIGAALLTVPFLRVSSRALAQVIPKDESYVITADDLLGTTAEVTLGPLDAGLPGQVRALDRHGNAHFVRARAAEGATAMKQGERVLLVDRTDAVFTAVPAPPDL